jgi:hypothetical protein
MPDEVTLRCARYQGERLARFAALLAPARMTPSGAPAAVGR